MTLKRSKRIEDYGGLEQFLDDPEIRASHNGYGYDDFVKNKDVLNKTALGRLFGLKRSDQIYRWLHLYEREQQGVGAVHKE